jgi:hypothetical protein
MDRATKLVVEVVVPWIAQVAKAGHEGGHREPSLSPPMVMVDWNHTGDLLEFLVGQLSVARFKSGRRMHERNR